MACSDFLGAELSGREPFALQARIPDGSNTRFRASDLFQDHPAPETKERAHATMGMATSPLPFAVRRRDPELVGPAAPTPTDTKRLSEIDDQDTLRGHVSFALVYRGRVTEDDDDVAQGDPVGVIRRALGDALVHYYPLAGRLREVEGRKLVVDCTGEGVLFVEADADVRLAELERGGGLRPPFPCMEQLLFDVEGSSGVLDSPLLLIQVHVLRCWRLINLQFLHACAEHMHCCFMVTRRLGCSAVASSSRSASTTPSATPSASPSS
jgi:hypothetical protein